MWAGQQRTPSTGQAWWAATPEVTAFVPEEATRKICGVLVARLPGKSWAPPLPTGTWGTWEAPGCCPCLPRPVGWRAGPPSADGVRVWRSPGSSPRAGELPAWRRGAASSQSWDWQARRPPVNTGAPWPTLSADEAEARVLGIQTKLHQWATGDPA